MGYDASAALGFAQFGGGMLDKLFSHGQFGEGLNMLEGLRGEEGGEMRLEQEAWGDERRRQRDISRFEGLTADWEKFGADMPSQYGLQTKGGQALMRDVRGMEGSRLRALKGGTAETIERAEAIFKTISTNLDKGLQYTKDSVTAAITRIGEGFEAAVTSATGNWAEAIDTLNEDITAESERAVSELSATVAEAEQAIDEQVAAGTIDPTVAAQQKLQLKASQANGMQSANRGFRAQVEKVKSTLYTNRNNDLSGLYTARETTLATARQAGIQTVADQTVASEQVRAGAGAQLTGTRLQANAILDQGWQAYTNTIGSFRQSVLNNRMTALGSDIDRDAMVTQNISVIKQQAATARLASTQQLTEAVRMATLFDLDVAQKIAGAHFGWGNTVVSFSDVIGASANTFATMIGAQSMVQQTQAMGGTDWMPLAGAGVSSAAMLGTAAILAPATGGASLPYMYGAMGAMGGCHASAEMFGGWNVTSTMYSRWFFARVAPMPLRWLYYRNSRRLAAAFRAHPLLKRVARPLWNVFVRLGERELTRQARRAAHGDRATYIACIVRAATAHTRAEPSNA